MTTIALTALIAAWPADAAKRPASPPHPARQTQEVAPRPAGEPIMAIVSLKSQRVTLYDSDGWILRAPVSSGTTGRETPAGVYAVIEKDKDHHSTLYDDAWMPNMQRITWNGIALHGGPLPGYAASHGCVRMPYDFAEKLFDKTRIGMRVIVAPNDAEPVDFADPKLFNPDAAAIAAAPAKAEEAARVAAEAAKAADEAKTAAARAKKEAAAAPAAVRKLELLKSRADADLARADKALAAAKAEEARAEEAKQKAAAKVEELGTQAAAANADEGKQKAAEDAKRKAVAAAEAAAKAGEARHVATAKAEEAKQKAAAKAEELRTRLEAAKADAKAKADAVKATLEAVKPAEAKKTETAKAALDAKLALEPVSILISRKTQKLYVRRDTHKRFPDGGEIFDFSIELPVTIKDPDKTIGTHVFTAMARNTDGTLRWSAVTVDGAVSDKDALDRITIPQEILDRIAPTVQARSSIIISDEGLHSETNYRTEFIIVLNDHPMGGILNRPRSPDARIARRDNPDDDNWFFGRKDPDRHDNSWGGNWGGDNWKQQPYRAPQPDYQRQGSGG